MSVLGQVVFVFTGDTKQVQSEIKKAEKVLNDLRKETDSAGQALENMSKKADAFGQVLGTLASLPFVAALVGITKNSAMAAAQLQVLGTAYRISGENMGYTAAELDKYEQSMKKLGIATREARQGLTSWIQMEMQGTDAIKLARAAQDLNVQALGSSSEAYQNLSTAIMVQYPVLLRQYGIMKYLDQIYAEHAVRIKKAVSLFTDYDRRMAFFNVIMEASAKRTGAYEASMKDAGKIMSSISSRVIPEVVAALGKGMQPALLLVVEAAYKVGMAFVGMSDGVKATAAAVAATVTTFAALVTILGTLRLALLAIGVGAGILTGGWAAVIIGALSVLVGLFIKLTSSINGPEGAVNSFKEMEKVLDIVDAQIQDYEKDFAEFTRYLDPEALKEYNSHLVSTAEIRKKVLALKGDESEEKQLEVLIEYLSHRREQLRLLKELSMKGRQEENHVKEAWRSIQIMEDEASAKLAEFYGDSEEALKQRMASVKWQMDNIPAWWKYDKKLQERAKLAKELGDLGQKAVLNDEKQFALANDLAEARTKAAASMGEMASLQAELVRSEQRVVELDKERRRGGKDAAKNNLEISLKINQEVGKQIKLEQQIETLKQDTYDTIMRTMITEKALTMGVSEYTKAWTDAQNAIEDVRNAVSRLKIVEAGEAGGADLSAEKARAQKAVVEAKLRQKELSKSQVDAVLSYLPKMYDEIGRYGEDWVNTQLVLYQRDLNNYAQMTGVTINIAKAVAEKKKMLERDAAEKTWQYWVDSHGKVGRATNSLVEGMLGTFEDTFLNALEGKLTSFKDFWTSIWKSINRVVATEMTDMVRTVLRGLLQMESGGGGKGAGVILGLLGGLFKGGGGSSLGTTTWAYGGAMDTGAGFFEGFDDGGFVKGRKGAPTLIKAHGGELVLPLHKLGKDAGAKSNIQNNSYGGNTIQVSVNAVDVNSFARLLSSPESQDALSAIVIGKLEKNTTLRQYVRRG